MARRTPQAYAGIEQWLERRYARRRVRYLYDCWCGQMAWTLLVCALGTGGLTLCDVPTGPPGADIQNMADPIGALGGEPAVKSAPGAGAGATVAGSVPPATALPTGGRL